MELTTIQKIALWVIPVLFAITVHEVAHGWVANKLGDPTAKMLGRLSLNPIKHIDPIGTIVVPGLLIWIGGFIFGWAKPVPVTWQNLKNPKRDMVIVALAGPMANLLMALLWASLMKIGLLYNPTASHTAWVLVAMGQAGVLINLVLMILNLLPIPPLDGGRVLAGLVPAKTALFLHKIEPYGFFIIVGLLATGILSKIMLPIMQFCLVIIRGLFGM